MRRLNLILAALLSLSLLTACGPARTEGTSASASNPVWTETDQWPDNEFTQLVPAPEAGTVFATAQGKSNGYDYFAVSLREVSQEEAENYIQTLKDEGFLPVSEKSEMPEGGSVVIGDFFEKGDAGVSLSFSGDTMGLYIARPQENK